MPSESSNMSEKDEMVFAYDNESKTFTQIPRSELAPGMIQVVEEHADVVWIQAVLGSLKWGSEYQHPPFNVEVRDFLREIKHSLDEVYPVTLEFWEDGFRRDANPEWNMAIWYHISRIYQEHSALARSDAKKKEIFRVLLGCMGTDRGTIKEYEELHELSAEEANQIISAYLGNPGDRG